MAKLPFRRLSRLQLWAFMLAQKKRRERRKHESKDGISIQLAFASLTALAARLRQRSANLSFLASLDAASWRERARLAAMSAAASVAAMFSVVRGVSSAVAASAGIEVEASAQPGDDD